MVERGKDAPGTVYRPATLGYRTLGSDGTRDEMHVCEKGAGSEQNGLVSFQVRQVLPRGLAMSAGVTFSGKLMGLHTIELVYRHKTLG